MLKEFLRWWTGESDLQTPPSKYKNYTVEYYPATDVHYALYKGKYLKTHFSTGIIETLSYPHWIIYAERCRTEAQAWRLIDLHLEQHGKENVKVITR